MKSLWIASLLLISALSGCLLTPEEQNIVNDNPGNSSTAADLSSSSQHGDPPEQKGMIYATVYSRTGAAAGIEVYAGRIHNCPGMECATAPILLGKSNAYGVVSAYLDEGPWSLWATDPDHVSASQPQIVNLRSGDTLVVDLQVQLETSCWSAEECGDGWECVRPAAPCDTICTGNDCMVACPDIALAGKCIAKIEPASTCLNDSECGADSHCEWPEKIIGCHYGAEECRKYDPSAGKCVAGVREPTACTMIYSPVCGKDGITYSNACVAEASGAWFVEAGTCGLLLD